MAWTLGNSSESQVREGGQGRGDDFEGGEPGCIAVAVGLPGFDLGGVVGVLRFHQCLQPPQYWSDGAKVECREGRNNDEPTLILEAMRLHWACQAAILAAWRGSRQSTSAPTPSVLRILVELGGEIGRVGRRGRLRGLR